MKKKLPLGSHAVFMGEFLERFSFWGLQSLIVLYLIKTFAYSDEAAVETQSLVISVSFLFSIVGGLIADRFFGPYSAVKTGVFFTILGNLILAIFSYEYSMLLGLSFVGVGAGLFVPNNPNLLGSLHEKGCAHRDFSFTFLYFSGNLGGTLAPIVYGLLTKYHYWSACFYISSLLILLWYFLFFRKAASFLRNNRKKVVSFHQKVLVFFSVGAFPVIGAFLLKHNNLTGSVVALVSIGVVFYLIVATKKLSLESRKMGYLAFLMILICMWFFANELQITNSFLLLLKDYFNRNVGQFEIPVPFFVSLAPFFIVALAPLLARLWLIIKSDGLKISFAKIFAGLILESLAFYWMAFVAFFAVKEPGLVSFIWVLPTYFLLSLGELCIMPVTISMITQRVDERFQGTFLGLLYLSLSSSAYLAGLIASIAVDTTKDKGMSFSYSYFSIGSITLASVFVLLLCLYGLNCFFKLRKVE